MKKNQTKNVFLYVAIISFFLCVFMGEIYRPWIYTNSIDDFGIAGSVVSFLGAVTAVFFLLYVHGDEHHYRDTFFTGIGCIVYEYLQPFLGLGYFDMNDIIGILLGISTSLLILCIGNYFFRFKGDETIKIA